MKNAERITQTLAVLQNTMAPWLCRGIRKRIPDYQKNAQLWWQEAVVPFATRFEDEQYRLSQLTDFGERTDALDVSACCNVLLGNWKNCFKVFMSGKANSWTVLVRQIRNDIAHIGGEDISDEDAASDLDTIAQLAGDEPLETEPDQTDAVSDLIRDEPIAAYENLKRYLTEEDKADIATLIRLRAEINQGKQ